MWIAAPSMVLFHYATGGRLTIAGLRRSLFGGLLFAGQIGLFFEAVQRIGGYSGYGEVKGPIRMAAHRRARLSP